jgi:hypothetical protein
MAQVISLESVPMVERASATASEPVELLHITLPRFS